MIHRRRLTLAAGASVAIGVAKSRVVAQTNATAASVPATRDPEAIPFARDSVWNAGIGSGARWGLAGDADVRQLRALRGAVNAANWGQPIYFGKATDPIVT